MDYELIFYDWILNCRFFEPANFYKFIKGFNDGLISIIFKS